MSSQKEFVSNGRQVGLTLCVDWLTVVRLTDRLDPESK